MTTTASPERVPEVGELVQVRSRRWLVEEVIESETPGQTPLIRLACADDDAQGQELGVYWEYELDRRILEEEGWGDLAAKGFDPPAHFSAFLHTLRWNCVTATDPSLFQSPFRAGIKIDAYQMEPLRKALRLPTVNLFIADDTGLGKTIEAGLIARELLLRKKAKTIVVSAPPSVLEQWQAELEERFGLVFEILDRAYLTRTRRERGFGVNPWRTHSRLLFSHSLLTEDAPELELSRLLDEYRTAREARLSSKTKRQQAASGLLVVGLQQRLLSSIEAFARSLAVHRATVERQWGVASTLVAPSQESEDLLTRAPDADDERAGWEPDELEAEEAIQIEAATLVAEAGVARDAEADALWRHEQELLDRMQEIADEARYVPDAKTRAFVEWIRENLCPGLPIIGEKPAGDPPRWNDRRVLIFTESREGTKRYLKTILEYVIELTDLADERIEVIDLATPLFALPMRALRFA